MIHTVKTHSDLYRVGIEITDTGSCRSWYLDGKRHKEDGPAMIFDDGCKIWWLNGMKHRIDGPAYEDSTGHKFWWVNDQRMNVNSQEQFERLMKLKAFL